jgi:cytochrome P450
MQIHDIPVLSGATRLGHVRELRDDRFALFERLNREHPDLAQLLALNGSFVFVNSPALLHEVLVEKAKHFAKSRLMRGALRPIGGNGLFTSEGDLWRRQRKLMAPLFTASHVTRYADVAAACAEDAAASLAPGEVVDVARVTTHVAMRVAGKTLFDLDTFDEADELGAALTTLLGWANEATGSVVFTAQVLLVSAFYDALERFAPRIAARAEPYRDAANEPVHWPGESTRRLEQAVRVVDRCVDRMIAERRAAGLARRDLLSLLLSARDEDGRAMTDKEVRDEILTLFIAGHETTASGLAWALYLLARHPEAYARARAEAEALQGRTATAADLPRLGFCLQVFKEAMRIYPPIYVMARRCIADVRVGGYDLPRGTALIISPWALHRRPEIWPDPERFDPSRFEPAAEQAREKLAYLPFGAGPRVCIGNHFSLMEGPLVLATLLARADLELTTRAPIAPEAYATLRPKGGVPMRVTARRARPGPDARAGAAP